jgi:5-methylthioadenosine/S-adenosylhomocysteine deaminase
VAGYLLEGGIVVTMDAADSVYESGAVLMENGLLTYVGSADGCPPAADARVIDVSESIVIPGLINAHCHSPMTFMRGLAENCQPAEWFRRTELLRQMFTDEDIYWSSLLGCSEMLLNGITCVADRYSRMEIASEAILSSGIRASLGPSIFDVGFAGGGFETLDTAQKLVERFGTSGDRRITCGLAPIGLDTSSTELLEATRQVAQRLGARIYIHVAQSREELEVAAQRGHHGSVRYLDSIGFLAPNVVAAHCIYIDAEEVKLLAEAGVHVAHCPTSNAKIEARVAPVGLLRSAGVNLALGTDCAASNNTGDLFRELHFAGLLHRLESHDPIGPSSRDLLAMVTRDAACASGLQRWTGSLEMGKRADVTVVDNRHLRLQPAHDAYTRLVYAASGADVSHVFVDGELLVDNGRLTRYEQDDLRAHARSWQQRTAAVVTM